MTSISIHRVRRAVTAIVVTVAVLALVSSLLAGASDVAATQTRSVSEDLLRTVSVARTESAKGVVNLSDRSTPFADSGRATPADSLELSSDDPPAEPITVKFELLASLHIAVKVKMNDAEPVRLIFDLGAPMNLVTGKAAAAAGLIKEEELKKPAILFGMRGERKVKAFHVGDVTAADVPVMVMDHPTIKEISKVLGPIDGIVGYPFFARYKFTIDYPASTITFTPSSDYKPRNVFSQMMGRMMGGPPKTKVAASGLWGIELEKAADDEPGVMIARVAASSAADTAGLKAGDRLITIDGRWTDSPEDALIAASLLRPGEATSAVIRRVDESLTVEVRPRAGI